MKVTKKKKKTKNYILGILLYFFVSSVLPPILEFIYIYYFRFTSLLMTFFFISIKITFFQRDLRFWVTSRFFHDFRNLFLLYDFFLFFFFLPRLACSVLFSGFKKLLFNYPIAWSFSICRFLFFLIKFYSSLFFFRALFSL